MKQLITFMLLLAGITMQAKNTLPLGKWEVAQITLERNIGDKLETATYNTVVAVKDYIRFPQILEVIDAEKIALSYPEIKDIIMAEYTIDDNKLVITEGAVDLSYMFSLTDGNLVLTMENKYFRKQSAGQIEQLTDNWIFTLKHIQQ